MHYVGDLLKNRREQYCLSLSYVAEVLKIREKYLDAIEKGDFNELPEKVYVLGYVKNYANFLGLNGDKIVRKLKENCDTTRDIGFYDIIYEDYSPNVTIILFSIIFSIATYNFWINLNDYHKSNENLNILMQNAHQIERNILLSKNYDQE